jgi:hypothetical protein
MSFIAAAFFTVAFLISAYAILLTLAEKWPRIEAVATMQGQAAERVIRVGQVRYTGQRLKLVVVNKLEPCSERQAFKFAPLRAA